MNEAMQIMTVHEDTAARAGLPGTLKLIHRDDLSCCRWFRGGVSQKTKGGLPRDN